MTDSAARILIVDDDPEITSALARGLRLHGYDPVTVNRVDAALARISEETLTAAIVDVMIGNDSGIDLVRALRAAGQTLPVVMLSALSEVDDRARGLEAGADDYIVKPFSFDELVARLKVQERRADSARPRPAQLDAEARRLTLGPHEAQLTERECALLRLLIDHANETLSRGAIFDALWAGDGSSSENVVDVYLGYLRKKIGAEQEFGFEIKTIRNKGFVIDGLVPTLV
ncbi:DNA-binding response regulator [Thalassococcus profundi]|uniref:DNA-binding response regulator n=1 Tax=Thalassococcus profundi TaxID=2282382 RepID=A0A369TJZ5_9RHOB|nr:response regulator transcription factor [Thalassococcus profundi]RDD64715.1 DNA-binding response regulator [Thalassococcus profundi]